MKLNEPDSPMPARSDKVETSVYPHVDLFFTLRLLLLTHIVFVLVVQKVDDRRPALPVVDIVAEPGGIDDGQLDAEIPLLQFSLDDLDFGRLVELLGESVSVVFRGDEFGREEGVDQGGFPQTGFTCTVGSQRQGGGGRLGRQQRCGI